MTRAEALTIAREHVEKMATNARGFQDGVNLAGKVAAVETLARFLIEDEGKEDIRAVDPEPLAAWERELLDVAREPGDRYRDCDRDVWTYGADGRLHRYVGSPGLAFDIVERDHGPLVALGQVEA